VSAWTRDLSIALNSSTDIPGLTCPSLESLMAMETV
jgi:hypothetical protein